MITYFASTGFPSCLHKAAVEVQIGKRSTYGLTDSGSYESFISSEYVSELNLKPIPYSRTVALASKACSGEITGILNLDISVNQNIYKEFPLKVMKNLCADIVLGNDFMKLHKEVTFVMGGSRKPLKLSGKPCPDDISGRCCNVAQALVKPPKLFQYMAPNCKPIATKSRRYSRADQEFIAKKVQKLLNDGIIEPSSSPWRAQVLVVDDGRHKKRMVIDFSQTVNRYTMLDAYPLPRLDDQVNSISQFKVFSTLDLKSAYYQVALLKEERPYTAFEACGNVYQYCRIPFGVINGVSAFQRIIDGIIKDNDLTGTFAYLDNITICGMDKTDHDKNLSTFLDTAKRLNLTFNDSKSTLCPVEIDLLGYRVSHGLIKPDPDRLRPLLELQSPNNNSELKRLCGMFAYYAKWIPNFSEKIRPLYAVQNFPLTDAENAAFNTLRKELANACLGTIDESKPFTIECDASISAIAAILNQDGRPVAFMSRSLTPSECRYSSVEKEASSIIAAVRKWAHYLHGRHFTLVTDQRSVAFMFDTKSKGKIKNAKIQLWRIELGQFSYDIVHKPGALNVAADMFSRSRSSYIASLSPSNLSEIHDNLGHPGVNRLHHFVRNKNLAFSLNDVRETCARCRTCAQVKPNFYKIGDQVLIKATKPWERINVDFKGPLNSSKNRFMFVVIDEYSRYPFAFSCADTSAKTVVACLCELFTLFGLPGYVHSDRGAAFVSREVKDYLHSRGVATSFTSPYHPTGNSQCERLNQTLWRTVKLILKSRNLSEDRWVEALPQALHSIRSLLCTATNATPHERFFNFPRKSMLGKSVPSWLLTPGPVLLRKFVRNKSDDLCDEVELIDANPTSARVRFSNGRESNVSLTDLAPLPNGDEINVSDAQTDAEGDVDAATPVNGHRSVSRVSRTTGDITVDNLPEEVTSRDLTVNNSPEINLRRSTRERRPPERYGDVVQH